VGIIPARGTAQPIDYGLLPIFCGILIVIGLLAERRFEVWTFPALGLLGMLSNAVPLMCLIGLGLILTYRVKRYKEIRFRRLILFGLFALSIAFVGIPYAIRTLPLPVLLTAGSLVTLLVPAAMALWAGRRAGPLAALIAVAAEFFAIDGLFNSSYALKSLSPRITSLNLIAVVLLPVMGFLMLAPIWAMRARSTRGQIVALLLPTAVTLCIIVLIGELGLVQLGPDYWLTRICTVGYILVLALVALACYRVHEWPPTRRQEAPVIAISPEET
jgi:hypothetical protein